MTSPYEWNPMPHLLDVKCPNCNQLASFEFAEVVRIKERKDIAYFKNNDQFKYKEFKDSIGHKWHGAMFYAGLHGGISSISNLPEGYFPSDWDHSIYFTRYLDQDYGSIRCAKCIFRKEHVLNWPKDAYFQISIKNSILWAFNRESCVELLNYIESKDRKIRDQKWQSFLLHIPKEFLYSNVRNDIIKKLTLLLK